MAAKEKRSLTAGYWTLVLLLIWQVSSSRNETSRTLLIAFLLLLLAGGIALLVRGIQELVRNRKESKSPADTGRKKAA